MVGLAAKVPSLAGSQDANCDSDEAKSAGESDREKPSCTCGAGASAREETQTKNNVENNTMDEIKCMTTKLATRDGRQG
ncbi:MAG: hypothetical protein Q9207_002764, partial [Kuettlingeria erythrocarpa]